MLRSCDFFLFFQRAGKEGDWAIFFSSSFSPLRYIIPNLCFVEFGSLGHFGDGQIVSLPFSLKNLDKKDVGAHCSTSSNLLPLTASFHCGFDHSSFNELSYKNLVFQCKKHFFI